MCRIKNNKTIQIINFLKKFYETNLIPPIAKKSLVNIFNNSIVLKSKAIQEATGLNTLDTFYRRRIKYMRLSQCLVSPIHIRI